jgi:iron-sulfur cluster repair protein YtfE (RIC family)
MQLPDGTDAGPDVSASRVQTPKSEEADMSPLDRDALFTAPLRAARTRIRRRLASLADRVGLLPSLPVEERTTAMTSIALDLEHGLRPHLDWEERSIHPVVDKFACEGPAAFSASMRYEHEIIYRGIGELREHSLDASAVVAFARRADNLLGVVAAHFELEEEVLFPILDRALGKSGANLASPPPC